VSVPQPDRKPTFRTTLSHFAPNPLMGGQTGRINFTMPREAKADVNIFDVNGRLVKTLFDGMAREGVNELVWDGNDDTGRTVSSGVYFIRLHTTDVNQQTKMV
jgi:flagellar hook assembly protein FlgD